MADDVVTKSLDAATRALTEQITQLNDRLRAREAPTMQGRLEQEAAIGSTTTDLGATTITSSPQYDQKTIEKLQSVSGRVGENAWDPFRTDIEQRGGGPTSKIIPGMREGDVQRAATERLEAPQYAWRLSSILRTARDAAIKTATTENEQGEVVQAEGGKAQTAANLAGNLDKWLTRAAPIEGARQLATRLGVNPVDVIQRQMGAAMGSGGAQLGFSPQTGVGGAFIAGIPNPLGILTSEAAKESMGQKLSSLGAVFSGGISYQQAQGLRGGLANQGYSNQKEGLLGLYTEGEQESMAEALEPSVKEGLNPDEAAGFANVTRYGQASIGELRNALKGLGNTAKTLKKTLDNTAASMQEYAKEQERAGALPIRSLEHYKEIAASGVSPQHVNAINQSPLGEAFAASKTFPGTIGAQPGGVQFSNAIEAAKVMVQGLGKGGAKRTNRHGEVESISNEEQAIAEAHQIYGVDPIALKAMLQEGPKKLQAEEEVTHIRHLGGLLGSKNFERLNRKEFERTSGPVSTAGISPHPYAMEQIRKLETEYQTKIKQAEKMESKNEPAIGAFNEAEVLHERWKFFHDQWLKAGKPSKKEQGAQKEEFYGTPTEHAKGKYGFWNEAQQLGISKTEFAESYALDHGGVKAHEALANKIEEKRKIKAATEEGKSVVELSPYAKKFFELKFPNATKEAAQSGGTPTSQPAVSVNPGNNTAAEAAQK